VLASRADRTGLPGDREIGTAIGVDHKLVVGYLRTLGRILPDLFPELVDDRDVELMREFAAREAEWQEELDEMEWCNHGRKRYAVTREVRAWRFRPAPRPAMPGADAVAVSCRIDASGVAERLEEARKDEVARALEAEFGDLPGNWRGGLAGLRRAYGGKWIEVAGEIAASVLRGDVPTDVHIASETGLARRTICDRRGEMQHRIEGLFALDAVQPEPEGEGSGG
jgi:hypothetical protein